MQACPDCMSPRSYEKMEGPRHHKHLVIYYEDKCYMKLEVINGNWKLTDRKCAVIRT